MMTDDISVEERRGVKVLICTGRMGEFWSS